MLYVIILNCLSLKKRLKNDFKLPQFILWDPKIKIAGSISHIRILFFRNLDNLWIPPTYDLENPFSHKNRLVSF